MKIYNEIVSRFNETTQQWEDIYEDSFDYSGPVDKLMAMVTDGTTCDCRWDDTGEWSIHSFYRWDSTPDENMPEAWIEIYPESTPYDENFLLYTVSGNTNGPIANDTLDSRRVRCQKGDDSAFSVTILCDQDQGPGVPGCQVCDENPELYNQYGNCYPTHQFHLENIDRKSVV